VNKQNCKMCPLRNAYCLEKECAVFDENSNCCGILSLSDSHKEMESHLRDIRYELYDLRHELRGE
jgi:hypothetical protein